MTWSQQSPRTSCSKRCIVSLPEAESISAPTHPFEGTVLGERLNIQHFHHVAVELDALVLVCASCAQGSQGGHRVWCRGMWRRGEQGRERVTQEIATRKQQTYRAYCNIIQHTAAHLRDTSRGRVCTVRILYTTNKKYVMSMHVKMINKVCVCMQI